MKKGFTLVELLAVIVILTIVLIIAVPKISDILSSFKQNAYESQVKLIEDAAKKYLALNSNYIDTGEEIAITLKDLQDSKLLPSNIKSALSSDLFDEDTLVFVKNVNNIFTIKLGYKQEGLVIYYDAIHNGGIGIHNDNLAVQKNIWQDLSGNNTDANLIGFEYDLTDGWETNYLKADGIDEYVDIPSLGTLNSLTFEILLKMNSNSQITWTHGANTIIIYSDRNAYIASNSGNSWIGMPFVINNGTTYLLTVSYDISSQKAYYFVNGILVKTVDLPTNSISFNFSWGQHIFADHNATTDFGFGNGNIYSVRMYDRALKSGEIYRNFEIDKQRYSF